jgi:hypothetical protein
MKTKMISFALVATFGVAGCAMEDDLKPDADDTKGGTDGKAEAWGSSDSPAMFSSSLEYRLAELPKTGQATKIPWAGNYWPTYKDNINDKWDGASTQAPSTKYGAAFGVTGVENAVSKYHGIDSTTGKSCTANTDCDSAKGEACAKRDGATTGKCTPTWFGICHAWAPGAILTAEPKYPVTHNGVTFKVQDIKALVTLAYNSTETKFVSLRCDYNGAEINFDNYGRPTDSSYGCDDTNPGTWHVLATNYLGKQGESFVEDRTYDDEVWNQPLRGYNVTKQVEVSALEANKLIGVLPTGGTTVERTGTVAKDAWKHEPAFAVTAGQLFSVAMTGENDADLYVNFGAQPTTSTYACRPYDNGTNETCDLTVPAGATQAFVSVNGYAATSSYKLQIVSGGSIPTTYVFNNKAAKLYQVHMDVQYISESPASTDGNLASTIDRYTNTDAYDYILEVDVNGKIIGGEWLGDSKRNHMDFVWLPIRHSASSVAGGKITYANVKMLLDKSLVAPGEEPTTGAEKTFADSASIAKSAWKHYGPFKVAAGKSLTATLSGGGDADLYVRKGAAPTAASYDCRPYKDGSTEACTVTGGGDVFVSVNGYATTSAFAIEIKYTEGTGTTDPVTPPATVTHLDVAGTVALGEAKAFSMDVLAGRKITVKSFSAKDVDLYVQMGQAPTTEAFLHSGYTSSGNETITFTPTSSGKLHIMVYGYEAASFTLRTSDI